MKRFFPMIVAIVPLLAAACAHQDLTQPSTQDNFGVQMAKQNLWREAMFRFQRAVEINPADARAHNNLAVAYEATGDFEKARKEYLEALKLDRGNEYIQKNYSRFVEFLSRNRKRQQTKETATASRQMPATGAATTTPGVTPDRPVGADPQPVKPSPPRTAPPSDLPPQPQPQPPATPPPGGQS